MVGCALTPGTNTMLKLYIIQYRFKAAGEKKLGPVRQFRVYADSLEEARRLAQEQGNYPDIEIMSVQATS